MNTELIDERRGCTSASNAQADLLCPGRHLAQKGIPHEESKDAAFGRRIHEALAKRDPAGLTVDEADIYESCASIEGKVVREFYGAAIDPKELRSWPEQRFWIVFQTQLPAVHPAQKPETRNYEHSGQPDRVYRYGQRLLVIEYKTLAGEVADSPRNLQVRDQAVICQGHFMADEVGAVVIQPLVTHTPEIVLYRKEDLDRAKAELFARVVGSNDPRSVRVPGDVQCKFCLAKKKCLEYQRWAGAMVPNMLSLLDVAVQDWTPDQRAIFCDRFDTAQKWLNQCWEAMEQGAAKDPSFVPGYAMFPGAERKKITNPQALFERFNQAGGTVEQFLSAVEVTQTRLKEQLSALNGLKGKKLDEKYKALIEGLFTINKNKDSLKKVAG